MGPFEGRRAGCAQRRENSQPGRGPTVNRLSTSAQAPREPGPEPLHTIYARFARRSRALRIWLARPMLCSPNGPSGASRPQAFPLPPAEEDRSRARDRRRATILLAADPCPAPARGLGVDLASVAGAAVGAPA